MYQLTEEGKEYLKKGLPEKRLLDFLKAGDKSLAEVNKFPNSQIAIGWSKKSGWITIENGNVRITEKGITAMGEETLLEKTMKDVSSTGVSYNPETVKILLSRNIITERKASESSVVTEIIKRKGLLERLGIVKSKGDELPTEKTEVSVTEGPKPGGIGQLTPDMIMYGKWKTQKFRKYDVTTPAPKIYPAKKQPYVQFIEDVRRKLIAMGFREMKGTFIETGFWNCDALFMPQDHPSRGIHDAFYMKHPAKGQLPDKNIVAKVKATQEGGWVTGSTGWGGEWSEEEAKKLMLRSQTTAVSARKLMEHGDKPGMFFNIDRVFRYDVIDAKHLVEFDQCEGIIIGENLTLRHLFGILKEFADMVGAKEVRYKPAYFPYTEPSCEVYMKFPKLGWVEMGGAGMFRPEVLRPLGIEKSNVLAWGFGLGRLAMMKMGIDDIRQLYSDDIDFLRNAPMVRL